MQITYARVNELFRYDGKDLIWKKATSNRVKKGSIAGHLNRDGYREIRVDGKLYYAHRLIWLHQNGYIPENGLDHINRNRSENKIKNLREASKSCNAQNSDNRIDNTSGVRGICFHKKSQKWMAGICVANKQYYLGCFKSFDEAVLHRLAVEQCIGWGDCNKISPAHKYAIKNNLFKPISIIS